MNSFERMAPDQIARLTLAITATAEVLGQTITSEAAEMMADDLADYRAEAVAGALKACRRELTGKLTLAAILQRAQAADGRPGKDEAWAIAMTTNDEFETVVLTDEIQLALAAAKPVLDAGDKIGARMAFISAYERFVGQAREDAKPVNWHVSVGFDANRRIQAVTKAMELKRIPREHGQKYLADLSIGPVTDDGRAIAGLLTGTDIVLAHLSSTSDATFHQLPARQGFCVLCPDVAVIRHGRPQKLNVTGRWVTGLTIG